MPVACAQPRWQPVLARTDARMCRHVATVLACRATEVSELHPGGGLAQGFAGVSLAARALNLPLTQRLEAPSAGGALACSLFRGTLGTLIAEALSSAEASRAGLEVGCLQAVALAEHDCRWDLIDGVLGVGVAANMLLETAAAARVTRECVRALRAGRREGPSGSAWYREPHVTSAWQRSLWPAGFLDLGLAHGTAGIVVWLCRYAQEAEDLIRAGTQDILRFGGPATEWREWPGIVTADGRSRGARIAWCYGAVSAGFAISRAGQVLRDGTLEALGLQLLRRAACRESFPDVDEAGICHGAAGLALMWNALFQETQRHDYLELARVWITRTLELTRDDNVQSAVRLANGVQWREENGLLLGRAGVALTLAIAASGGNAGWTRLFLL